MQRSEIPGAGRVSTLKIKLTQKLHINSKAWFRSDVNSS